MTTVDVPLVLQMRKRFVLKSNFTDAEVGWFDFFEALVIQQPAAAALLVEEPSAPHQPYLKGVLELSGKPFLEDLPEVARLAERYQRLDRLMARALHEAMHREYMHSGTEARNVLPLKMHHVNRANRLCAVLRAIEPLLPEEVASRLSRGYSLQHEMALPPVVIRAFRQECDKPWTLARERQKKALVKALRFPEREW